MTFIKLSTKEKNKFMQVLIKKIEEHYKKPISELDDVDWKHISEYQILPEYFIREFKYKVNWYIISRYQKLSEDFIRENQDKVYWEHILQYQKLSEDFRKEFQDNVKEKPKKKWYQFWK